MEASGASGRRLIVYEDDHLLVVDKPAGINTHSASPYSGEGIYEWFRRREPRWAELAILQRLDKDTSGVLIFSKSRRGNVSLNKQFTRRRLEKEYVFWTDRRPPQGHWTERSFIRKGAGRFESQDDDGNGGLAAETHFSVQGESGGRWVVQAKPVTGRTHQIRIHAANSGLPILGDTLYGGSPYPRLCLHARSLSLRHPATNESLVFCTEPDFTRLPDAGLREAFVDRSENTAYRRIHGAADGHGGWYVDRLGEYLLASTDGVDVEGGLPGWLTEMAAQSGVRGVYHRRLDRQIRGTSPESASPRPVWGERAPEVFEVWENGVRYGLSFAEGYSVGLFLDQRDNRRRLLVNWIGPEFPVRAEGLKGAKVLNAFAYTCGFSVAAAKSGAVVTSLDLSKKYLEWGRRNFEVNQLDAGTHDFIYGDAFDWMRRLGKKGRRFDVVIVDPPTFSQSKERGVFRAETDFAALVTSCVGVLEPGGVLLASTNAARLEAENWMAQVGAGVTAAGRTVEKQMFVPQPPDFPTCREEPGYLKTVWARVR